MPAAPRYPLMLDVAGRRCLVVGGGTVAARKVAGLVECGADVTVVSPAVVAPLADLVAGGSVSWLERPVDVADLAAGVDVGDAVDAAGGAGVAAHAGAVDAAVPGVDRRWRLVVAATNDAQVNRLVAQECERLGIWAVDASSPRGGSASTPAVHRRGPLTVAVSTSGVSLGAAAWLRDEVAGAIDPAVVTALELLAEIDDAPATDEHRELRAQRVNNTPAPDGGTRTRVPTDPRRRADWQRVLDSGTLDDIRHGRLARAKERLLACLSSSSD